jgi:hypothetical protein
MSRPPVFTHRWCRLVSDQFARRNGRTIPQGGIPLCGTVSGR